MKSSCPAAAAEPIATLDQCPPALAGTELDEPLPLVDVLGVHVEALTMEQALARIASHLGSRQRGYLCAVNVHGVMQARRDPGLAAAYAGAAIAIPDGMPIAWVGRLQGHRAIERVAGPELMREVFLRPEFARYSHFFYGGAEGVADELVANFRRLAPHCTIVGTFTPPFRELTLREESALVATVNRARPDMIWVGTGTPKQDKFMRRMLPKLQTRLMFGVGAAFDFHTGRLRDCAPWMKSAGLQWFHRLLQDPKRLWLRYLRDNPAFLAHVALQLTGLRTYTLAVRKVPDSAEKVRV